MKELLASAIEKLSAGEPLVWCTVTKTRGSTPRDCGAVIAVFLDGKSLGSIGGGAVEYECLKQAKTLFDSKTDAVGHYILTANQAADIGMICGGDQDVYLRYIPGGDGEAIRLFERIIACFEAKTDSWLFTRPKPGGSAVCDLYTKDGGFLFGHFRADAIQELPCRTMIVSDDLLIQPASRSEALFVFGAGHVSRELAPLLAHLDFSVTVFEQREAFAKPEFFPGVRQVICAPYEDIFSYLDCRDGDYAVVMTSGHESDLIVQKQLLTKSLRYIGVIGSRRKAASQRQQLLSSGFGEDDLSVIHSPVGLSIGAQTPAEIAISVAAELIELRSREK